jgi:hypothetical protein
MKKNVCFSVNGEEHGSKLSQTGSCFKSSGIRSV